MKKTLIALTTAACCLGAGAAFANCTAYQAGGHQAISTAVMTAPASPVGFIRTGGYGKTVQAQPDIVDTAVAAGTFSTLVKAVQAAGLVDTLKGDGPYTVFAPTDEAFAKLPAGTLESLLADPDKLAQVLKYHVVPGKLDASAVTSMTQLSTVQGSPLAVGDISIAKTDIMTSNGIIHVIDEVLIPQG